MKVHHTHNTPGSLLALLAGALLGSIPAAGHAASFKIAFATDLFTPTTRGGSNTTWVGWDTFDDGGSGSMIINDSTPDIGTSSGTLTTTNGEDHISGSFNYYSSTGTVAETADFTTSGTTGTGVTTIIMQGVTLFGGFGTTLFFSDIGGVSPDVVPATNIAGKGQFWAKWEVPGNLANYSADLSSGPFSFISFDKIVVDTYWSPTAFSVDTAKIPEPSVGLLGLASAGLLLTRRRRVS